MTTTEWSLTRVFDVVGAAIPERDMIVWGDVRRTFGDALARADALAAHLRSQGLGLFRERADLAPWECGQDRVAVLMHNRPEHVEAILGCWRARAVPCNVNYQYTPAEIAELFRMLGTRGVVYERGLAPLLADALAELAHLDVLVELDDGSDGPSLPGAVDFETIIAAGGHVDTSLPGAGTSPDDIYVACTGGTTGRPKAVLWRQGDLYVAAIGGTDDTDEAAVRAAAQAGAGVWFPTSPLMHVAAQWTVLLAASRGATVVLHDDRKRFDAPTILATAARERANMMTIIGDAYARPLVEELERGNYDLSALAVLGTGGTPTSAGAKDALSALLPKVIIRDGYGASEIGVMGSGDQSGRVAQTQHFDLMPSARILTGDKTRFLEPTETEVGWIARTGHVPLGYLGDEEATEATFPVVDGRARLGAR